MNVPQLRRLPPGDRANVFATGGDHWGIDEFDVIEQRLVSHHFIATEHGFRHYPIPFRLRLARGARPDGPPRRPPAAGPLGDWHGRPFTAESASHVSVRVKQ